MPKYLYRFRPFNNLSVQSLIRDEVFASTPDRFNDPYDGRFAYNQEKVLRFLIDEGLYEDFLKRCGTKDVKKVIDIHCSLIEEKWSHSYLVACFSEEHLKEMMWSHYGDGGKGFAIKYDVSKIEKALLAMTDPAASLHKVNYVARRTDFAVYLCRHLQMWLMNKGEAEPQFWAKEYPDIFFEKNSCWQEEKEWRILRPNKDFVSRSAPIHGIKPEGIILGENADRTARYVLCSIAKKKGLSISMVRPSFEDSKFGYVEDPLATNEVDEFVSSLGANILDTYFDALAQMNNES